MALLEGAASVNPGVLASEEFEAPTIMTGMFDTSCNSFNAFSMLLPLLQFAYLKCFWNTFAGDSYFR
jgi:hypothetical protein